MTAELGLAGPVMARVREPIRVRVRLGIVIVDRRVFDDPAWPGEIGDLRVGRIGRRSAVSRYGDLTAAMEVGVRLVGTAAE